jgi:putative ABC transport system permease protein
MESTLSVNNKPNFKEIFWRFTLRHIQNEPARFIFTLLGIALGIALMVAIRLANGAAISSFQDSIDLMAGKANLSLSSTGVPLPETLLKDLVDTRRLGQLLPVVEGKMAPEDNPKEFITVLGVDLLKDGGARDFQILGVQGENLTPVELLKLLPQPDGVFISQKYAEAKGLAVGQKVRFFINDQVQTLTLVGLLQNSGVGRAMDGTLALMDIAAAQKVFGKIGKLDRLDWIIPQEADRKALEAQLQKLYPSYKVERPARRGEQVEKMLAAFRANLLALSLVSVLVGAFLVYNSMSIAVVRRVEEIGILRTLGITRKQIIQWVMAESFLLALAGVLLGIFFGKLLAYDVLKVIGKTIQNLYLPIPLEQRLPSLAHAGGWILLGLVLILAATIPPALSTASIEPGLSVRKGYTVVLFERRMWMLTLAGLTAWALAVLLSLLPPLAGLPWFGFGSAFCLLIGLVLLAPSFLSFFNSVFGKVLRLALPSEGYLAFRNLLSDLSRSSVALGALVMAVALMVSVAIMVGSFRQTVVLWLGQTLKADLYIRPAADRGGPMESTLDPLTLKAFTQIPGVKYSEKLRTISIPWNGTEVAISAIDMNVLAGSGTVVLKSGGDPEEVLKSLVGQTSLLVSEPLALKHQIQTGDWITLNSAAGPVSMQVKGVYYDYSNDRGTFMMDRSVYAGLFKDDSVNGAALYLQPNFSPDSVTQDILKRLPAGTKVFIQSNAALKGGALKVFDQTFAITYGMEAIALIGAVLGILTTLTSLILERREEIVILRYIGARRNQVTKMILWEAGWIGLLGNLMGFLAGVVLALLLINVINVQSFGWTIQWHMPGTFLIFALGLVFAATLAAGFYPARVADNLPSMREVTKE